VFRPGLLSEALRLAEAKDLLGSHSVAALESSCPGFQGSASAGAQQPARL